MSDSATKPETLLQIHMDRIKPGCESAYLKLEEEAARACAKHNCPHPYLAMRALSGVSHVWFVNAFDSAGSMETVTAKYSQNTELVSALTDVWTRKGGLVSATRKVFAILRSDLSYGPALKMGRMRFWSVTTVQVLPGQVGAYEQTALTVKAECDKTPSEGTGLIYQAMSGINSGTFLLIRPVSQFSDLAGVQRPFTSGAVSRAETQWFSFEPSLSLVSEEWVNENPSYWKPK